jgi:hypothetical protein
MSARSLNPRSSAKNKNILALLSGGDRRSIGRNNAVAAMVLARPALFRALIKGLWDQDAVVRMRAADAAEKVSRQKPELLQPFKAELLGLLAETTEQEVRWHMAQMIPRLSLTTAERAHAASTLRAYLDDRSSIVKTFAMQGLADLALADKELLPSAMELLERLTQTGTPAMRARGRKLLARVVRP